MNEQQKKLVKLLVTMLLSQGKPIPPEYREIAEEIKREGATWAGETTPPKPK